MAPTTRKNGKNKSDKPAKSPAKAVASKTTAAAYVAGYAKK